LPVSYNVKKWFANRETDPVGKKGKSRLPLRKFLTRENRHRYELTAEKQLLRRL